jgi:DNA-binding NtrC family response regulator
VADDEERVRAIIERTLALADYAVVHAENGTRAIERLRSGRFDLLITDLKMPGADGLAVIREARRLHPDLPVVIITGHSSEASAIEAINLGVSGYLTKPFRVPKVLSVVSRALGE